MYCLLSMYSFLPLLDLDPDSESGSGSNDMIESRSDSDPELWLEANVTNQCNFYLIFHVRIRIHRTELCSGARDELCDARAGTRGRGALSGRGHRGHAP
jgi:hypothetical protein